MIISDGYNGTPSGFENFCEDDAGYAKWYVLHAEANAILKVARSTQSCQGATLYITMSPCKECSKLIHQAGIIKVVYAKAYKADSGLKFLEKAGIELELIDDITQGACALATLRVFTEVCQQFVVQVVWQHIFEIFKRGAAQV